MSNEVNNILIIGGGKIGLPLAQQFASAGNRVWVLRRSEGQSKAKITFLQGDVTDIESLSVIPCVKFDLVYYILTPEGYTDAGYRSVFVQGVKNAVLFLQTINFSGGFFFISSTGVYGNDNGEVVNEETPAEPDRFSGKRLLEGESILASSGLDYSVIRFGGIYGPGRYRLIKQVLENPVCTKIPVCYTNRIHVADVLGILQFLGEQYLSGQQVSRVYLGVDCESATMWDVKNFIAEKLNRTLLEEQTKESPRKSKRCDNRRIIAAGYCFRYPDYRSGYQQVIESYLDDFS